MNQLKMTTGVFAAQLHKLLSTVFASNLFKTVTVTHEAGNCHWKRMTSGHFVAPNGCQCEGIQQNWKHPMTLKPNWTFIFVSMISLHFNVIL